MGLTHHETLKAGKGNWQWGGDQEERAEGGGWVGIGQGLGGEGQQQ